MQLNDALKNKLHDVRLRDKLIAEGKITQEEVEKYLQGLEDDSNRMEAVQVEN